MNDLILWIIISWLTFTILFGLRILSNYINDPEPDDKTYSKHLITAALWPYHLTKLLIALIIKLIAFILYKAASAILVIFYGHKKETK